MLQEPHGSIHDLFPVSYAPALQRVASGQGAGPSRRYAPAPGRRVAQQQRPVGAGVGGEVVDLTGADTDVQIVRSTVRAPTRGVKRPRPRPPPAVPPGAAQLSPVKQRLLEQLRNPPPPPPPEPEPEGPKCGICMEVREGLGSWRKFRHTPPVKQPVAVELCGAHGGFPAQSARASPPPRSQWVDRASKWPAATAGMSTATTAWWRHHEHRWAVQARANAVCPCSCRP